MARNSVLRWLDGRGWLILSGGHDGDSEIRAQAIGRSSADGGVAYVTMGGDSALGEKALADMDDLGAPSGYLVDVLSEDDATIQKKLADAGMIVVESGTDLSDLRSGLMGAAAEGMKTAFENGAIILVEGLSAAVFGRWVVLESGKSVSGLAWLDNALVVPGVVSVSETPTAFNAQPSALAVGLGVGSALALGPDGELETWGRKQVTVALGPKFQR
jgi:hypothetical protein